MTVNDNLGEIKIQNEVVATIASIAMAEVPGVVSSGGKRLVDTLRGQKGPDKGVKVEIVENRVKLTIEVSILYGNTIYDVSRRIQQQVKNAVEQMTGLIVESVDVVVRTIVMTGKDKKASAEESGE